MGRILSLIKIFIKIFVLKLKPRNSIHHGMDSFVHKFFYENIHLSNSIQKFRLVYMKILLLIKIFYKNIYLENLRQVI